MSGVLLWVEQMENNELQRIAEEHLRAIGEMHLAKVVRIYWNPRMRSTAGRALLKESIVEMNPHLMRFGQKEVVRTILHEIAHLVAWERYRHRGHGKEWQYVCVQLGIPGEKATHTLDLPRRTQRKQWRYKCPRCQLEFDRVRRAKAQSACAKCCQEYNGGQFSKEYLLEEYRLVYES